MIRGFYTATSAMLSQQTRMDTIANNLANVSTTAFKPQQVAFSSLVYRNINGGAANTIPIGHGVKVQQLALDFTQGELRQTHMPMDCAILGDGFFAVESREDGSIYYTRDGSFRMDDSGRRSYLVNASGDYVLNSRHRRISTEDGFNQEEIGVFTFDNPYGLKPIGGNRYAETDLSGNDHDVDDPVLKTGFLEGSSVDLSREMVKMIEASKGFVLGSRIIQTADEMERVINQLR